MIIMGFESRAAAKNQGAAWVIIGGEGDGRLLLTVRTTAVSELAWQQKRKFELSGFMTANNRIFPGDSGTIGQNA